MANQSSREGTSELGMGERRNFELDVCGGTRAQFALDTGNSKLETRRVKPLTMHTCKLTDEQAAALDGHLREHGFKPRAVPYARFAGEKDKLNVVFYESGKLVVQGKGTQEFVEFVLEPEILKQAELGYEEVLQPEMFVARIGVDE